MRDEFCLFLTKINGLDFKYRKYLLTLKTEKQKYNNNGLQKPNDDYE